MCLKTRTLWSKPDLHGRIWTLHSKTTGNAYTVGIFVDILYISYLNIPCKLILFRKHHNSLLKAINF